ncbi:MAG: helix-turn-helix domain-containing protein [Chitinophagales bacterium]
MKEIGQLLREARERQGIPLEQVYEATRINPRYVAALETGEFEVIPGEVYLKGFLREYARLVGLDGEELVGRYRELKAALAPPPAEPVRGVRVAWQAPRRRVRVQERRKTAGRRWLALVVVALAALATGWALAVWSVDLEPETPPARREAPGPPASPAPPSPSATPAPSPPAVSGPEPAPAALPAPEPPATSLPAGRPAAAAKPAEATKPGPQAPASPAPPAPAPAAKPAGPAPAPAAVSAPSSAPVAPPVAAPSAAGPAPATPAPAAQPPVAEPAQGSAPGVVAPAPPTTNPVAH